jgi:O-antigen ligase
MSRGSGAGVRAPQAEDWLFRILHLTIGVVTSAIGVAFQRNRLDSFRIPKQALYEAEAIVCLGLLAILLLWRYREVLEALRPHRLPLAIAGAAVLWTGITSLTSTNRTLSMPALVWVASCATVFVATLLAATRARGLALAWLPLLAAAVNAVFALLQRAGWFSPTQFEQTTLDRYRISGLIGNPNDLGVYLFLCALPAVALLFAWRGRSVPLIALAVLLTAALLASQTMSALIAFAIAILVMIVFVTRRVKLAAIAVGVALLLVAVIPPLRQRTLTIASQLRQGSISSATSLRVPGYLVAWELFVEHPIVGAGPGTYGWWYLPHKIELNKTHAALRETSENFGEAHNDHLQTLAVSGLPAYAIFVAAIIALGATSFRSTESDTRSRFVRALALPFAAGFAVVTLAQFPLEVASAASVAIHYAALCCAWTVKR